MRLIDADALVARLEDDARHMEMPVAQMYTYGAINDIQKEPTVAVMPQWTPVVKKLPDKYTTVIVSCVDNSGDTSFSYTACGYWVGLLPDDDPAWIVDGEVNYHVVAWMPLPKPYRKEGEAE